MDGLRKWLGRNGAVLAAAVLLLAGGGGVLLEVTGDGNVKLSPAPSASPEKPAAAVPSVKVEGGADLRDTAVVSPAARAVNARVAAGLDRRRSSWSRVAEPRCRRDFSGGVYSSRGGIRPTMFVLHFTVSQNRPGWSDVYAILNYFEDTRVGSSTFIMDFEANCLKMVPESQKPWTQLNANPYSISVEIVATGSETNAQWRASKLIADGVLARKMFRVMGRWHLPVRWVDPSGCDFSRAGYTDHDALECSNHHWDVGERFPFRLLKRQLAALARR